MRTRWPSGGPRRLRSTGADWPGGGGGLKVRAEVSAPRAGCAGPWLRSLVPTDPAGRGPHLAAILLLGDAGADASGCAHRCTGSPAASAPPLGCVFGQVWRVERRARARAWLPSGRWQLTPSAGRAAARDDGSRRERARRDRTVGRVRPPTIDQGLRAHERGTSEHVVCIPEPTAVRDASTVEPLITHTPRDRPKTMGFHGVWIIRIDAREPCAVT